MYSVWVWNVQNRVGFWGSAPDPAGGAYDAPQDPLVVRGFLPSAIAASSCGFNTDYGSSEPLKTLVMLCYEPSALAISSPARTLYCIYIFISVAVLGFWVWGANGAGIFVWGAKWRLSAEGAKLRLPKARSPSRLGGLGIVVRSPSGVWGGAPETDAILNISSQNGAHLGILLISHF